MSKRNFAELIESDEKQQQSQEREDLTIEKLNNWIDEYNQFKRENPNVTISTRKEFEIPRETTSRKKTEQHIPEGLIREFRYIQDQIYENEEYNHHLFLGQRQYYNYQQFLKESNNSSIKDRTKITRY